MNKIKLKKLENKFEKFKDDEPFPEDCHTTETISDIHDDLAEYDSYVAGALSSLIKTGKFNQKAIAKDLILNDRLKKIIINGSTEEINNAKIYLKYLEKIEEMIDLAFECLEDHE